VTRKADSQFDRQQARQLLDALFEEAPGLIELRPILPDGPASPSFHAEINSALDAAEKAVIQERNTYMGVAARCSDASGKKDNLKAVSAFWVDIDHKDVGGREALMIALETFPLPPSIIVWSGGGHHVYWLLDEPYDLTTSKHIDRCEYILKGLCDYFDGDFKTTDASRILRVPGTPNLPDAKKRTNGRVRSDCFIESIDSSRRYSINDFEEFEDRGKAISADRAESADYERKPWDGELPESVKNALESDPKLRARWEGDATGLMDDSPSEFDLSIASRLARKGISGAEIEAALRYRRDRDGCKKKTDKYFRDTVVLALGSSECATSNGGGKDKALLEELARLSPIEYDRRREEASKQLGIRVTTLDEEIKHRRPRDSAGGEGDSAAALFPNIEPWSEPVDGAELLSSIRDALKRFVAFADNGAETCALWVLAAWSVEAFFTLPFLAITSPEKRCGKTTLVEALSRLVPRSLKASNITPAALFRSIEKYRCSLLIDEADTFLDRRSKASGSDELRGILNAGHSRASALVIRTVGEDHEPVPFNVFGPKVIACIGDLPDTIEDRSITVRMSRRRREEQVKRYRMDRDHGFRDLARRCARWTADYIGALKEADPEVPDSLHDRAADNWRPLVAIANAVGGNWPKKAREAAEALSDAADEISTRELLLADIRDIFEPREWERVATDDLLSLLHSRDDRPWGEWKNGRPLTKRGLRDILRYFKITSKRERGTPRLVSSDSDYVYGYTRIDFDDAFSRYLPPLNRTNRTNAANSGTYESSEPDQETPSGPVEESPNSLKSKGVSGWSGSDPPQPSDGGALHPDLYDDYEEGVL